MTRIPGNGGENFSRFISKMTKTDALAPIIALEVTVVGGRTIQAYKRGGQDEARERLIEESMGSIVWLFAVKFFNYLGDKILGKILKQPGIEFDVGTDKLLRTPFDNFIKDGCAKKYTAKQVALMKGAKVVTSVLLGNLIIGWLVPKVNHALTNKVRHKRFEEEKNNQNIIAANNIEQETNSAVPSFKGAGFAGLNWFTNAIENTNTGKLLSTDIGCAGGRMLNARKKEERREIAIRDIGSIYFYMWAQGHVRNILNYIETGNVNRLSPDDAQVLQDRLEKYISKHNNSMSIEEFKKGFLGKPENEIKLPEGITFETGKLSGINKLLNKVRKKPVEPLQVVKISELKKVIKDNDLITRLEKMAKLQPERLGEAVITKQQIIDTINTSEINNPEFLSEAFNKFTDGASSNKYKYVSNKKLYNYKKHMEEYVELLCKKSKDGKITSELLKSVKRNNYIASGLNFVAGFGVAALFLSTLIPKFQYWVTRKTTGVDAFPGVYDYENHREVEA
ncbi:MAG: hypothetical protein MJ237_00050 [bacterium]|nr:hypothetical protein [bacterium]